MEITLSILIATMPKRAAMFHKLRQNLCSQAFDSNIISEIEILHDDSMLYNIGTKRNKLLQRAKGRYIVFIDDDDKVANTYVKSIVSACKSDADCIGISGTMTTDGMKPMQWHISKYYGLPWRTENNTYLRTPNHISPVKRELALQAMFPEIHFGEDAGYSQRLFPLLNTEVVIPNNIYHYEFKTNKKHGE